MKLIDILVSKGDGMSLFGVHTKYLAMDPDGRVHGYCEMPSPAALGWGIPGALYSTDGRGCLIQIDRDDVDGQWQSAIITREQYEAALAAKNDGWIEWNGGKCPLHHGAIIDAKDRDGYIHHGEVVGKSCYIDDIFWRRGVCAREDNEIIAYRLHQPTKSEQVRADAWNAYTGIEKVNDEADLNECIGQDVAPVWNGEGLPPVGCECEYSLNGGSTWWKCKIDYIVGTQGVVMLCDTFEGVQYVQFSSYGNELKFRTIRSKAERKRDEAAQALCNAGGGNGKVDEKAGYGSCWFDIYDAIAAGEIPGIKLDD